MTFNELEGECSALYVRAGADMLEPPGILALARGLLGVSAVRVGDTGGLPARLEDGVLCVRARLAPSRLAFFAAHEIAEWWLERIGIRQADREHLADGLAVRLMAPAASFREAVRLFGPDPRQLADCYCLTQTAAVLRLGEATSWSAAVIAGNFVRRRGDPCVFGWSDPELRALSEAAPWMMPGVRRYALTDANRVALVGE